MTAYTPQNPLIVLVLLCIGTGLFLIGLCLNRRPARRSHLGLAWGLVIVNTIAIECIAGGEPSGVRMVVLIFSVLWSMKLVVLVAHRLDGGPNLLPQRWLGFLFGWLGMRPAIFAKPLRQNRKLALQIASGSLFRTFVGLGVLVVARSLVHSSNEIPFGTLLTSIATMLLLIGISLVLHFGVIDLLAAGWQFVGINCQPVFRAPLASASLSEFWGRRWNLAFSEMTSIAVFRPLQPILGKSAALWAGFAFSGVLHELAITVPVRSGFGGPFSYFALHGLLVLLERRFDLPRRFGSLYRGWIALCLILPLPVLFPPDFLRDVAWPLVGVVIS